MQKKQKQNKIKQRQSPNKQTFTIELISKTEYLYGTHPRPPPQKNPNK